MAAARRCEQPYRPRPSQRLCPRLRVQLGVVDVTHARLDGIGSRKTRSSAPLNGSRRDPASPSNGSNRIPPQGAQNLRDEGAMGGAVTSVVNQELPALRMGEGH